MVNIETHVVKSNTLLQTELPADFIVLSCFLKKDWCKKRQPRVFLQKILGADKIPKVPGKRGEPGFFLSGYTMVSFLLYIVHIKWAIKTTKEAKDE